MKKNSFPMTLELSDSETQKYIIEKYEPEKPQWWITGFNPEIKPLGEFAASRLVAIFEVDFETKDKFEAFMLNKAYYVSEYSCAIERVADTSRVKIVW